jgi:nitroimidazol reductase NimA-like FMN-containing flavoprotein (pyridoxamine 5'-phosphate oxidase superfamily)
MSTERAIEVLGEAECLRLIAPGGIGRIAYSGRFGQAILPVNYKLHDGAIVFRTALQSALDEDLQTGIGAAEYRVAFEIDELDMASRQGWSVLIQGAAHRMESASERACALDAGVENWAPGERDLFVRIALSRITGRRIRPA